MTEYCQLRSWILIMLFLNTVRSRYGICIAGWCRFRPVGGVHELVVSQSQMVQTFVKEFKGKHSAPKPFLFAAMIAINYKQTRPFTSQSRTENKHQFTDTVDSIGGGISRHVPAPFQGETPRQLVKWNGRVCHSSTVVSYWAAGWQN